jgi:GNAT superfamily N-acetyltransferase
MTINLDEIDITILNRDFQVKNFHCNKKPESERLQFFLRTHALDNQDKHLSITWVAVEKRNPLDPIGYFSLACASIDVHILKVQETEGCPKFDRYPALLIGKFAVADKFQDQGFGTFLMDHVYARAIKISENVGCRYLIVESKPTSTYFYGDTCKFVKVHELECGNVLFYKSMETILKEYPEQ